MRVGVVNQVLAFILIQNIELENVCLGTKISYSW